MTKEYKVKLNEKQDYGTGATRDTASGKGRFDLIPDLALERVAKVYEKGACNHEARNWELGLPMSRMVDSALRHIHQYKMSKYIPELREEDHLAHCVWNLLGILHFEEMIKHGWLKDTLDDLPKYGYKEPVDDGRWKDLGNMLKKDDLEWNDDLKQKRKDILRKYLPKYCDYVGAKCSQECCDDEDKQLEIDEWLRDCEDRWDKK